MVTKAWNPAVRAGAGSKSCDQKSQNSLTLKYYSLNPIPTKGQLISKANFLVLI